MKSLGIEDNLVETAGNFILGLADKEELLQAQKLRYDELVLDYDSSKSKDGTDASEYDDFCDHLIVKDLNNNKVVGTYRLMSSEHLIYKDKFISESEFDISKLKSCGQKILELGRAVVNKDYRQGTVLKLLWRGIMKYAKLHNIRYLFGMSSFHGVDENNYKNAFSKLYYNYLCDESIMCPAKSPCAKLNQLEKDEYSEKEAKLEMPSLIKGYLAMGCKVGKDVFLDYDFNSADVMIILDLENINMTYFNRMFGV